MGLYGIVDVRRESVQTGWATSVTRPPLSPLSLSVDQLRNPTPPTDNASPGFPHLAIGDMLLPDLRRGTKHAMLQYADTRAATIAAQPRLLLGLHYRLASYMCSNIMMTRLL